MVKKLKYIHLFEGLTPEDIPYSEVDDDGDLSIIIPPDIKELPPVFNELTDEVIWGLLIDNNQLLTSVTGFNNLTRVGGYLVIEKNQSLNNITGFNSLTEIGRSLIIRHNQYLTEVTGFNSLTRVGEELVIINNQLLTNVVGFDNLTQVSRNIFIDKNQSITRLPGFNNLNKIDGFLRIENNQSLTEVTGFNSLTQIDWDLSIKNNESLTEVAGFNSLNKVDGSLTFNDNQSLTNITGFKNLTQVRAYLWIRDNPKLVAMSIPGTMVRSVDYLEYGIKYTNTLVFKSPPEFINSPVIIDDLVEKLNPGDHSTQVGIQIAENLKEWGTQATIDTIVARLKPEQLELFPDDFKHLHSPEFKNTSVRDVAKFNSGQIYGIF